MGNYLSKGDSWSRLYALKSEVWDMISNHWNVNLTRDKAKQRSYQESWSIIKQTPKPDSETSLQEMSSLRSQDILQREVADFWRQEGVPKDLSLKFLSVFWMDQLVYWLMNYVRLEWKEKSKVILNVVNKDLAW